LIFAKPRVITTGAMFVLLTSVPMISVARWFQLFGLSGALYGAPVVGVKNSVLRVLVNAAVYYPVCLYVSSVVAPAFVYGRPVSRSRASAWTEHLTSFLPIAIFGLVAVLNRRPRAELLTSLSIIVLSIILFVFSFAWLSPARFVLTGWFWGIGLAGVAAYYIWSRSDGKSWKQVPWEGMLGMLFLGVWLDASQVFEHLEPAYGGGGASPVTVFLQDQKNPFAASQIQAQLSDETSVGFYVRPPSNDASVKQSYFVPRTAVALVKFDPAPPLASNQPKWP
jgi:hypothetical protein